MTPYTNQTAFDQAARGLLNQGKKSIDPERSYKGGLGDFCMYRSKDGLKCGAGHLIPDELYQENMESVVIWALIRDYGSLRSLFQHCKTDLINNIQDIHDHHPVSSWKDKFYELAVQFELAADVVDEFKDDFRYA